MPSTSANKKKLHEQEILKAALNSARMRGGECRRLSDQINGMIIDRSNNERPDLVLLHESDGGARCLIGVEHFRVDQFLEWNAKAGKSVSAVLRVLSRLNCLGNTVRENEKLELNEDQREELCSILDELWAAQSAESHDNFIQAFSDTFKSHLSKAAQYRENTALISCESQKQKLAFLIETHVDYSHSRFWNAYRMAAPPDGVLPMFRELVELFRTAIGSVDYLILAMCPRFGKDVVDARIVNCSSLASSLSRQKVEAVEYLGYSRSSPNLEAWNELGGESHAEVAEDSDGVTDYPLLVEGERLDDLELFRCDMDGFAQALVLRKERKPFIASFGVSMLLELFGDYAQQDLMPGIRFDLSDLVRWKEQMGTDEWQRRDARFRNAHNIKDELLKWASV